MFLFYRHACISPKFGPQVQAQISYAGFSGDFACTQNRAKEIQPLNLCGWISGKCRQNNRTEMQKSCPLNIWGQDFVMIVRQQVAIGPADRQQVAVAPRD